MKQIGEEGDKRCNNKRVTTPMVHSKSVCVCEYEQRIKVLVCGWREMNVEQKNGE